MTRGKFITLEGGEGAGKSTQARLLADALQAAGYEVVVTREPGGTPGAEAIRHLLLDPQGTAWSLRSEALLFAAARANHVETLIRPALERGAIVVCDRYIDSTRAYQGGEGRLPDAEIMAIHRLGTEGFMPHLTLLVEVDPATVTARLALRDAEGSDRIGGRDADFHAKVARRFAAIAATEPERVAVIDGNGSAQTVHVAVLAAVRARLGLTV
ncbi:dTMP kinase [Alteraurantiacibacter buctensis]|uniref:Thymidylate kinase n=1 Tax=Alteraurantiacibacter buctensis TaxID=1503981 RepID=A0A844YYA0_9SPHN|nr:dTMP kinase [Alteraurantiacibacter buctensis]